MGRRECDAFGSYRIRIDGYRLKNGKLVLDARRLSVSQSLRQAGSKRVRAGRPGCARRIRWHVSGENTMDLVGVWQRIAVRHKDNTPPGIFRLAPGASDFEIDQFEAAIGLTLPPDVRESLFHSQRRARAYLPSLVRTPSTRIGSQVVANSILNGREKTGGGLERTGSPSMFAARSSPTGGPLSASLCWMRAVIT